MPALTNQPRIGLRPDQEPYHALSCLLVPLPGREMRVPAASLAPKAGPRGTEARAPRTKPGNQLPGSPRRHPGAREPPGQEHAASRSPHLALASATKENVGR